MNQLSTTDNLSNTTDFLLDPSVMQQMISVAKLMSQSRVTVPKHLQGAEADCLAVVMQAAQWRMNPFAVAQKTHFVNGQLGYEAQLVNAVIASSRAIVGRFKYEYEGDWPKGAGEINWEKFPDASVRVGAVLQGEDGITWGEWLHPASVKVKNSPLWKTAPKQQSAYLAVKYWSRLYCPDVILGVYTVDEFEDTPKPKERDVTPSEPPEKKQKRSSQLMQKLKSSDEDIVEVIDHNLSSVLDQINAAESKEALSQVAHLAAELSQEQQIEARSAYKARLAALNEKEVIE
ncbi:RecT family recombinase [Algicola sagamiensis]|uniref:RecT family recombinase n=1 Tax=Algicola sagamiensis TaxID=163869 RepID=UPI0003AAC29E|nr:RecT family recombinase [Algicola sagamiensis]